MAEGAGRAESAEAAELAEVAEDEAPTTGRPHDVAPADGAAHEDGAESGAVSAELPDPEPLPDLDEEPQSGAVAGPGTSTHADRSTKAEKDGTAAPDTPEAGEAVTDSDEAGTAAGDEEPEETSDIPAEGRAEDPDEPSFSEFVEGLKRMKTNE
ncbi:hypothetical protein [Nocardiopsis baichengensis]|uniref:hypothetical protein n=1 Tax=Nocardiopsis baichengensis TaxID=280240 RepID=UPI001269709F|nr:hypothetical protein [Nocardiopsis baichengensis]